ncbi:MAG: TolC family outer membrane protein [Geminicoccaceae bacterium]
MTLSSMLRGGLPLVVVLGTLMPVARPQAMTMNDALSSAYETNPQLAAARAQLRKTDEGIPQALAAGRPTLEAEGGVAANNGAAAANSHGSTNTANAKATAGPVAAIAAKVPIWTGGRVAAAVAAAHSQVDAGRAALRSTEEDTLLRAATAYVDVLRAQNTLEDDQRHEQHLRKELASAQRRRTAGELRDTDVSQTQAQLAQAQARRIQAEGDLDDAREVFRGLVGAEPESLRPATMPPGLPGSRDEVIAASADNPALVEAADTVDAARSGVDVAQAQLRPSIGATASLGTPYYSGEVLLTIPLFDGGLAASQSRSAKQELEQRRLELDGTRQSVRQDALTAWQALVSARSSSKAFQAQVDAAQAATDGLRREQRLGLRTQIDVLTSAQQLLDAQLGLENAKRDSIVAAYRVLAAIGQLSAEALNLPVTPYDAKEHATAVAGRIWDGRELGEAYFGRPRN